MKQALLLILSFFFFKSNSQEKLSLESILKLEPDEIIMKIDDYINKLSKYGDNIESLNPFQKSFFLIENFEKEINNGGFNQFYFNSSGNYSLETVDALYKIGAKKTAKIVEIANSKFPNKLVPKNWEERQNVSIIIDENIELWNEQDKAFYKSEENITELLIQFIIKNKTDFEN